MTDRPTRVALLGAGRIASMFHAPILRANPSVELAIVADADPERSHLAEGVPFVSNWHLAIERDDVDAVVICLPPAMHAEAAIAGFEAGKHVFVEKPVALTAEDAARVEAAWRASGKTGMVGFNFRFQDRFEALRAEAAGADIVAGQAVFTSAKRALPGWKQSRETGGSVLRDLGVHHADLLPHLLGEPIVAVSAREAEEGRIAWVSWEARSGLIVQGFYALVTGHSEHGVDLMTAEGHIGTRTDDAVPPAMRRPAGRGARTERALRAARALAPSALLRGLGEPSFSRTIGAFVDACRDGQSGGAADIADGARALSLVLAAEESAAAEGRRVTVPAD
ncbi:Gfo/Idh/MocA family protein [Parvularcula dongshanensis]|uniref:Myo-inositol 2-dehydrogenase/D-chiro-inositol 1-dehydrogenase n=1 Tax=Parvularcula dongshanensis TaxID=1173995 RepID=A0A840I2L6_9PROT|nr:Gfo/Idh/MocA family oxidoreductase [Parvularcula dongshanensis]MBB4659079.1 myo-inositol 2-dehydrogenase/D-chiro-inositol 1-dehydrogenase [Parvularcula dongshanensis]